MSTRRSKRLVAVTVAVCQLAVACSDEADDSSVGTVAASTDGARETRAPMPPSTTAADAQPDDTAPEPAAPAALDEPVVTSGEGGAAAMTVTVDLDPDAVWEDGTPVTVADIECTWRATLNTPGSILRDQGYDRITAVTEGDSDRQAVIEFGVVYAPYKTLFDRIIKAASVANCDDISGDFSTAMPISGRGLRIESFSPEQLLLVPNEAAWPAGVPPVRQVVIVPVVDRAAELAALESGALDFISPQFDGSLPTQFADPNIAVQVGRGAEYEALYFQQRDGPFADPVFREAFSKSIDRQALFDAIYQPIFAAAGVEGQLHNCGPVVDGPYCPAGSFETTADPAAAAALLTDTGWVRDSSGYWSKDGVVPEIRWMVNDDTARRQAAQTYLIPLLAEAGFHVVADNCDFRCVFLQRLPTLDYDLAMFLSNAWADPGYLTQFTCDQVPTEQNSFVGRNQLGWCNQEASEALYLADATLEPEQRVDLVQSALRAMATDHVLLPLATFPPIRAWRTDRVGGAVSAELASERGFDNVEEWTDVDGDGRIVIGAEQLPSCLNPVTSCADSPWYAWTVSDLTLPGIWRTTGDGSSEVTPLVVGEPSVELAG